MTQNKNFLTLFQKTIIIKLKFTIMDLNNTSFITLTSHGYEEYTLNMLKSLEQVNLGELFTIYCLDNESFTKFKNLGYKSRKYDSQFYINNAIKEYGTAEFNMFMYAKMDTIRNELGSNTYVLYSDGDVVFKKTFFDMKLSNNNFDFIAMKDFSSDSPERTSVCAGFMLIKSNLKTKYLFNPSHIEKRNFLVHDQDVINSKKKWYKYSYFSEDEFSNGSHFTKNYQNLDPKVIHFNYIIGDEKKKTMKDLNCWYL